MRILFMGTPEFSVPTLEALIQSNHQIVGVVTQPDKPKGRGNQVQETPVKVLAQSHQIPVYQPMKVRDKQFIQEMSDLAPDVAIVIAYGQIVPQSFLDIPKYGCINIHASLLPKYRGAGPIQWCIINGETETGITLMQMDVGMDTGDMLVKKVIPIDSNETGGTLHDKLMQLGGPMILELLDQLVIGNIQPIKQNNEEATYAPMLAKELGQLNFQQPAETIKNLVQGLNPWPSAYTTFQGKTLKIWACEVVEYIGEAPVGTIIDIDKHTGFTIKTGKDAVKITECQLQGKNRMRADAFMRGYSIQVGEKCGE